MIILCQSWIPKPRFWLFWCFIFEPMTLKISFLALLFYTGTCLSQEPVIPIKSYNYFGLSGSIGGGLELNDEKYTSGQLTPSASPNLGVGLFWQQYWYFSKNNGLIFGGGVNWLAFTREVEYTYTTSANPPGKVTDHLGRGFRNHLFTLDIPIYFTHRFTIKKGEFNQYAGVCLRTISGLLDQGGTVGRTEDIQYGGSTYYSEYDYSLGVDRIAPIVQPTFGVSWTKQMKNGGRLNYSVDYKLFFDAFSTVEARYENTFNAKGGVVLTPNGPQPVESVPMDYTVDNLKVNLSGISVGIFYSFK